MLKLWRDHWKRWEENRERPRVPPVPPFTPPPELTARLLTVTRDGDRLVLRDQGIELRRMHRWQALSLIARLAMAVRDTDGA